MSKAQCGSLSASAAGYPRFLHHAVRNEELCPPGYRSTPTALSSQ